LETFPAWSPDGRFLYYCSAKTLPPGEFKKFKYDLLRIAFNPETNQFGKVDTIVSSARTGMSVSLPRISPDGKYVLFSMSSYGTFLLWHEDSDLYLMNLETGKITKPDINSNLPESYHSWSSSGRWIVFSSKRSDGFTTQPYFTYFDAKGQAHKPFVLPQRNPEFYKTFLRSYNVPELVTSKVKLSPRNLREIINYEPADAHLGSMK
jgi:dipeptidyl aminopeptidase/acylaminoacyl peptidase